MDNGEASNAKPLSGTSQKIGEQSKVSQMA
jgi:hypothetical protein